MSTIRRLYGPLLERSTWDEGLFLIVGFVFAGLWASLAVLLFHFGIARAFLWAGVPVLVLTQFGLRGIAVVERNQVRRLLGVDLGPVPALEIQWPTPPNDRALARLWAWMKASANDGYAWRVLAWILVRGITGPVGTVLAVAALLLPVALVLAPAAAWSGAFTPGGPVSRTAPAVSREEVEWLSHLGWLASLGPVVALLLVPVLLWALHALADQHRTLARWALGPSAADLARAATARAELAEEQVRIDQELHDSIGHMITMNVVQAGAGGHVFDTDPEFARQALKNIEERGRAALGELDRIIATIRGDRPETRAPLPGIAEIDGLVETCRRAGVAVHATVDAPGVPDAVGRAAHAVVRESLTNAAKHAPGADVRIRVAADGDALGVEVVNSSPPGRARAVRGPADGAHGHTGSCRGLAGIRDRVGLLGGRTHIGPTEEGGFAVLALLPLDVSLEPTSLRTGAGTPGAWDRLRGEVEP